MAVFRVERNKGYTVMSNHHLRNRELSLKAKGLLSQMLYRRLGAGKGRIYPAQPEPGRQGQDGRDGLYHLRAADIGKSNIG